MKCTGILIFDYMKPPGVRHRSFNIGCGQTQVPNAVCPWQFLYESLTNILELKDFRFSLWQVFLPCRLYEKVAFKSTSAEPLPRRAIGTGQLSRLRFRAGPIARRGGGGMMPFSIFVVPARAWGFYMKVSPICWN